jgi:glutaredoxin 3
VATSPGEIDEMLVHSGGRRDVPVIVDEGKVTIGYGGS